MLKDIKAVLIDIDDTLLDFNACANVALKACFTELGLDYKESYFGVFLQVNESLWAMIESGAITRKQHRELRFKLILEKLNVNYDSAVCEELFRHKLYNVAYKVDGAIELLEYLSKKYVIYAASNAYVQQLERIKIAGIDKYFKMVFLSEQLGATKPNKEFFDGCFKNMNGITADQTVMIGDSLVADIKGAYDCGLKTIWYNPKKKQNLRDIYADFSVSSLLEIKKIL